MPQSHPAQLCTNPTGVKSCAPLRLSPSQAGNVRREDLLFPESYEEFCLTVTGMSKTESFFTSSFLELLPASRTMIHYQPARQSKLFYSFSKNIHSFYLHLKQTVFIDSPGMTCDTKEVLQHSFPSFTLDLIYWGSTAN